MNTSLTQQKLKKPSSDIDLFLSAWQKAPVCLTPYPHYLVKNLFNPELLHQLNSIPFKPHDLDYALGTREEFNPFRRYFCSETVQKFECAQRVANIFLSQSVMEFIENKGSISLKDALLRIEYTMDTDKFWLGPHTDLGVKLFTMLIYLSDGEDSHTWGTDIYYNAETHYACVPYEPNSALIFFPSNNTWHGFEPRKIKGIRKTLIVNYVTQEWRNRHELVHPINPVY